MKKSEINEVFNGNYKIITKIETDTEFGFVIGYYPDAITGYEYVTWIKNSRGYDSGHYFHTLKDAQRSLVDRYDSFFRLNLHERFYNQFVINDILAGLHEIVSYEHANELINDKDFLSQAVHNYNKLDLGVDQAVIDMIRDEIIKYNEQKLKCRDLNNVVNKVKQLSDDELKNMSEEQLLEHINCLYDNIYDIHDNHWKNTTNQIDYYKHETSSYKDLCNDFNENIEKSKTNLTELENEDDELEI